MITAQQSAQGSRGTTTALGPLLEPRSVAVVGATERPDAYADNVLRNLERAGFPGPVWGVNPKRERVHGRPCVASVSDLPEAVDAVVVAIPAALVPGVIAEAGERGCAGAVVLSAGFGEVAAGQALEDELRRTASAAGIPVCGPNGNGIVSVAARAPLWGDSVPRLEAGPVAMISQSGNIAVNAIGSRRGIGYHTIVSTGNQAVLDASDWLAALAEREGVRSVALFLEADGDGARFAEALALCAEHEVGVAVLKVGSSAAGAAAAAAHTGSLAGDQRIFRALVEEAGGAWARDPHELLEMARALAEPQTRPVRKGGLAVLTCSGGDSGAAADEAERVGVELPPLAPATRERLAELLPDAATVGNPLDYTAMIWADSERLARIVAMVGSDPAITQILALYDHPRDLSTESAPGWAAVRAGIVSGAERADAAVLVASTLPDLIDDDASRELARSGVPAIAGLPTALACVLALRRPPADPARVRQVAAAARIRSAHVPQAGAWPRWLDEVEAKGMLAAAAVEVPDGRPADDLDDAVAAAAAIGYPVALKLCSAEIRHKSEAGALALGLADERALRAAHRRLLQAPVAAGARVLVERMAPEGVELFVAARADGVVPALAIGLGGIWAEALDDVAIVPLPASPERVERALGTLRGSSLLAGGRGRRPLDLLAASSAAARAGRLMLEEGLDLVELNPIVVHRRGCTVVDATAHRPGAEGAGA